MGRTAILSVDILADARDATAGFEAAAAGASRASEAMERVGDSAGDTATGLSAIGGALEAAGFGQAADALGLVATGLDAAEGATILYRVAQENAALATKAWGIVQTAFNAVMAANPIGLVILAIVGLIAVVVLIAKKTDWFSRLWRLAWAGIKAAAKAVWDWLGPAAAFVFGLITKYVQLYVRAFTLAWQAIKAAAEAVWRWLGPAAKAALDAVLHPVQALERAWDAVVEAIKRVIEWIKKIAVPDVVGKVLGHLPGVSGATVTGGLVLTPLAASTAAPAGGTVINIYGALDPVAVARQVRTLLTDDARRRGGVRLGTVRG